MSRVRYVFVLLLATANVPDGRVDLKPVLQMIGSPTVLTGVYVKLDVELVARLLVLLQARLPPVAPLPKHILISIFHSLHLAASTLTFGPTLTSWV